MVRNINILFERLKALCVADHSQSDGRHRFAGRTTGFMLLAAAALAWLPAGSYAASEASAPAAEVQPPPAAAVQPPLAVPVQPPVADPITGAQDTLHTRQAVPAARDDAWLRVGGWAIGGRTLLSILGTMFLLYCATVPGLKAYQRMMLWLDAKALGVRRIITVEDADKTALLTPAALHERGWPLEMMQDVLGPPDYAVVDPTGRFSPLIFLSRERVEMLEKSEKFRRYHERRMRQARIAASRVSKWIALQEDGAICADAIEERA